MQTVGEPELLQLSSWRRCVATHPAWLPSKRGNVCHELGVLERCNRGVHHRGAHVVLKLLEEPVLDGAAEDYHLGAVCRDRLAGGRCQAPVREVSICLKVMDAQIDDLERGEPLTEPITSHVVAHFRHPLAAADDD